MNRPSLWKKLKSLTIIGATGTAAFTSICLYKGNERFYKEVAMPALHRIFSAETSQAIGLFAAKWNLIPMCKDEDGPLLKTTLWGIDFPNPVGIAAGLDKNAEASTGLFRTGIGFLEVGTVTPVPQSGNPMPRIFTLTEDEAIINRCGFNSKGHKIVKSNLESAVKVGILGINLGKNKDSTSAEEDYVNGIREFCSIADYFAINVSSPNTPGLRLLQKKQTLEKLLDKILEERRKCTKKPPILLKISPDLSYEERKDIADVLLRKGKRIDGIIISNTTIDRPNTVTSIHKREVGGLSGKPLTELSTTVIREMYRLTKGQIPIIGVGGISSGKEAYEKIKAGASLVQIYTAFAYNGPPVIPKIKRELKELLIADHYTNISSAVGIDHRKNSSH